MLVSNNYSALSVDKNYNCRKPLKASGHFQSNLKTKNPSFGSVGGAILGIAAASVLLRGILWLDDQKWSGPSYAEICERDAKKAAKAAKKPLEPPVAKLIRFLKHVKTK